MTLLNAQEVETRSSEITIGNKKVTSFAEIDQVFVNGKTLLIYVPYDSKSNDGILSIGIRSGTNSKYSSYRHSIPLLFDNNKEGDVILGRAIVAIQKSLSTIFESEIKSPMRIYKAPDGSDKISMWCRLVESKDGKIYTKVYDKDIKHLNIESLTGPMLVRPAISVSVSKTKDGVYHMKCTVKEMCVVNTMVDEIASVLIPTRGLAEDDS